MSLDLKKRYTNAIAKKLDQLDKCPDKELASQEGVELNLVEISVPEDDDKLLDV